MTEGHESNICLSPYSVVIRYWDTERQIVLSYLSYIFLCRTITLEIKQHAVLSPDLVCQFFYDLPTRLSILACTLHHFESSLAQTCRTIAADVIMTNVS